MITLISLIITLGILVTVHEYGHFWVARKCKVKVLRFSIGFGKPLFSWHDKQGTEFVIAAIPLGGYVKMLDSRESPVDEAEKQFEFTSKPVMQRIAIVAAGPLANFLFAILAYWVLFMVGVNGIKPYVSGIEENSVADNASISVPMVIAQVDQKPVQTWSDVQVALFNRLGDTGTIQIQDELQRSYQLPINTWLAGAEMPDPVSALGLLPLGSQVPAIIDVVEAGSAAELAGLLPGDQIISVNDVEITHWRDLVAIIQQSPELTLTLGVSRGVFIESIDVTPRRSKEGTGFLGVSAVMPEMPDDIWVTLKKNPVSALFAGVEKTWNTIYISFSMFGKMLSGLISPDNIGGPISIAKMAGQSAQSGLETFIGFLAFISISLGVVNLLPIPVLDGGHLLYYVVELIIGKPLSARIQDFGFRIGASLLFMLMAFAIFNDIGRLL